jgi:hypothetical protein
MNLSSQERLCATSQWRATPLWSKIETFPSPAFQPFNSQQTALKTISKFGAPFGDELSVFAILALMKSIQFSCYSSRHLANISATMELLKALKAKELPLERRRLCWKSLKVLQSCTISCRRMTYLFGVTVRKTR